VDVMPGACFGNLVGMPLVRMPGCHSLGVPAPSLPVAAPPDLGVLRAGGGLSWRIGEPLRGTDPETRGGNCTLVEGLRV